ncbi:curved DNA-binding protein [Martelella alba]|uniref:Curved DNA-binding protein n=1 Tax=Martelella alba TaxID=2590451 RepID=A0ABY2SKN9_9HYPH|nr:curved DNA-binding protein [Martelella alba]TKI06144.1 curved DNA-binding protein [Martelella alba]
MDFKDYYAALGVEPTADLNTIKTAYRRLARKYHPDVSKEPDAESRFKDVAEAYEVLKDSARRAEYDELRKYGRNGRFEAPPGWQPSGGGDTAEDFQSQDFSDFFASVFGAHARSAQREQSPRRGRDVEIEVAVFLEETLKEHQRTISYQLPAAEPFGGRGQPVGKTLKVKIPAGVADGDRIRVKGQGPAGPGGGPNGDLYLVIRIAPHPLFDIDGNNLLVTLPLAPWEAALGAKVTVPTLTGKITLSVPPNSQTGQQLRVKGKGLQGRRGVGDLYALIKVVMPPQADERAKKLWADIAAQCAFNPRAQWE